MNATEIDALVARLTEARDAYYNHNPIMSDAAYDALEDKLRAADPNHAFLAKVGAPLPKQTGKWAKARHSIPMGSLKKAHYDGDNNVFREADGKTQWKVPDEEKVVSHKLDGISIDLTYKDRKLVQAITRGEDGTVGEDITRNVLLMEGAVKMLPPTEPATVYVRGEIICRKSSFKTNFPGESNPRNTASGTARRFTDYQKVQYLTVVAYQYLPDGVPLPAKANEFEALEQLGFITSPHYVCKTSDDLVALFNDYVASKRDALDYDIDGLVIEVNDRDIREAMGSHNMRPNGARALKFPHASALTTLRAVDWQVGKSGRITPVAIFDTVNLAGANVSRASLHNPDYIDHIARSGGQEYLSPGDIIEVERRNDVIPGVAALHEPNEFDNAPLITVPKSCPECGTATERDGAYLICPNKDSCPAQISGAIKRWLTKIGVKHFGDALVDLLCETGKVERIADLYTLDPIEVSAMEDKNCRKVGGTATKAFNNLHAKDKTTLPLHVFLGSLGIPLIGRSMAKTIVDGGFDSLHAITHAKLADIESIPGVGTTKAEAFLDGFWDLLDRGVITSLMAHISIAEKATGVMSGQSVCMTGFRDAKMVAAIEAAGGTVKSSVSKTLTILVTKDPKSTSGKAGKARKYNADPKATHQIKIISQDEMWKMLS